MKTIKQKTVIRALCIPILILLLTSCGAARKTTSTSQVKDTTLLLETVKEHSATHSDTYTRQKDTAIGIAGKTIETQFSKEDLQPVYTQEGKPVARTFYKDTAGISMKATVNPDGSVNIQCKADSLTMVVKNLDSTVVSIHDSVSYWKGKYLLKSLTASSDVKETKVYDWVYYLKWAGLAAIVLAIIGFIINRFL